MTIPECKELAAKKYMNYQNKETGEPLWGKIVWHSIVGLFVLMLFFGSFKLIGAGERGVILTLGAVQDNIMGEGFNLKLPFFQSVKTLDVKTHKHEVKTLAYSKDIQTVDSTIALNYHLDPLAVNKLWQEIGKDYEIRIIDPSVQEAIKVVTAKFTAQNLIEQRTEVREEIKVELLGRLTPHHIIVDEFSIVNFDFSDAYEKAVEEKQVAQQQALKAENDLRRIKVEADSRIAQARGEAEAIRIQAQAITQQGGREYVNLKWVEKWNGQLPTTNLGSAVPLINIGQ